MGALWKSALGNLLIPFALRVHLPENAQLSMKQNICIKIWNETHALKNEFQMAKNCMMYTKFVLIMSRFFKVSLSQISISVKWYLSITIDILTCSVVASFHWSGFILCLFWFITIDILTCSVVASFHWSGFILCLFWFFGFRILWHNAHVFCRVAVLHGECSNKIHHKMYLYIPWYISMAMSSDVICLIICNMLYRCSTNNKSQNINIQSMQILLPTNA